MPTALNDLLKATSRSFYLTLRVLPARVRPQIGLALASFHECDYFVTWNCRHLANASKFGHIRRINTLLGLNTPELVTPPELLGDIETLTQQTRPSRKSGRCGIAAPRST